MSGEELILNELEYQTIILESGDFYLETISSDLKDIKDMVFWISVPLMLFLILSLFKR